jgi:hypothetical protein
MSMVPINISMNTFCRSINIDIDPLFEGFDAYDINRPRNLNKHYSNLEYIPLVFVNPKLKSFMDQRNIMVSLVDIFYCGPYEAHPIHVDQPHVDQFVENDYVRINWIYGGEGSEMKWYKFRNHIDQLDRHKVQHIVYGPDDVECIHSQAISGPHLVQVGIPHTVQNQDQKRHSICADIIHKDTGRRITMNQALNIFKDLI